MRIPELIQKLKTINVSKIIDQILKDLSPVIEDMQKLQLELGLNPEGDKFGDSDPYTFAWYAELKHRQNSKPGLGNPDLIRTGSFRDLITAKVKSQFVEIKSRDPKNDSLARKYEPFGLTSQHIAILIDLVYEELEERLRKILKIAA